MKKTLEHGFLDHLLVLIACSSSLFALGESLNKHALANFLAVGAAVSVLTGYFVSKALVGKKIRDFDGYLWTGFAICTSLFSRPLNQLLPEEGFPFMLFAGTWLSWMVLLCGLVSWRDQTLLFLNLPCLSVFALVGTFDTFAPATMLFFVFLVCSSLLYARIHQRSMLRRAQLAGYKDPDLLERDAWRWVAGPEWAFASAGAIVILSLVFGPLLRFSLQPVSGTVKVGLPQLPSGSSRTNTLENTEVQVGKGSVNLPGDTVFKVKVQVPSYLRTGIYMTYMGNGWSRIQSNAGYTRAGMESKVMNSFGVWQTGWPDGAPLEPLAQPVERELTLRGPAVEVPSLPTPGPIKSVWSEVPGDTVFTPSGLVFRRGGLGANETARVRYLVPSKESKPGAAKMPESWGRLRTIFTDFDKMPRPVIQFFRRAAQGGKSDFERAQLVKEAIERTSQYTLNAPPVSPSGDAVEQFLFTTKLGYCDLFATAMVMGARAVGIPSRYTVGYLVQENKPDENGLINVIGKDAHAWAELYFENVGWVPFDATEGAQIAPEEVDEKNLPWFRQKWALYGLGATGVALLAGFVVYFGSRTKAPKLETKVAARQAAFKLHKEFDRAVRKKTGVTRRFSQTTSEYVDSVRAELGPASEPAIDLSQELEKACFGEAELDKEDVTRLTKQLRDFGKLPGASSS